MIIAPLTLLSLGIMQVFLWNLLDKKINVENPIKPALNSFRDLTLLMIPIYLLPPVLVQFDITQFVILIPYVGVSTFWYLRWRYHRDCSNDVQKEYLHKNVTKMFYGLNIIGLSLLAFMILMSTFTTV